MSERTSKITEWRRGQAIKLQINGLTHAQIAERLGVSKAYISLLLQGNIRNKKFHAWNLKEYKYPAIAKWANENQVSRKLMTEKMGYPPTSQNTVTSKLKEGRFSKEDIDVLIDITGMKYEELFRKAI